MMIFSSMITDFPTKLILASASPRRKELLAKAGAGYRVLVSDADESFTAPIAGDELVKLLSHRKASAVADTLGEFPPDTLILAADTVVVSPDGTILGKPVDAADAKSMLTALSGTPHHVYSGFTLLWKDHAYSHAVDSIVTFKPLPEADIDAYIATGEPFGKAGAYAIQGLGGNLVAKLDGDFTNVVGLPMPALEEAIRTLFGKSLCDFIA